MNARLRSEDGQVLGLTALFIGALVGVATLVIDVGVWFREDRRLQAAVDAAAVAGAQALPEDPARAVALAVEYAGKNGGGVAGGDITVSGSDITVRGRRSIPGFLSRVFGIDSVDVGAGATARAAPLARARYAAPFVVHETHPLLQCSPDPCFEQETVLGLANLKDAASANGSGAFGLLNFEGARGTVPTSTIAGWVRNGYDAMLGPGLYRAATGAKFNSAEVRAALTAVTNTEVILPVYRTLVGTGQTADFQVVGWVGFVITGYSGSGDSGTLRGTFRKLTWEGEPAVSGEATPPDFGATTIALTR